MERIVEAIMGLGLVISLFGAMAADSPNMIYPVVIIIVGILVMGLGVGLAYLTGYDE